MKIKDGLRLRKLGRRYMLVRTTAERADLSEVFTFNETAAFIFEKALEAGQVDAEALVKSLTEEYEVDEDIARRDIMAILDEWKNNGIVE